MRDFGWNGTRNIRVWTKGRQRLHLMAEGGNNGWLYVHVPYKLRFAVRIDNQMG